MQEKQETRHVLPPVGWLAYCRFVQEVAEGIREQERKSDHASAN